MSGEVTVSALVTNQGIVKKVWLLKSSGFAVLDNAALVWFEQVRYYPNKALSGNATSTVRQTIHFILK
jgi:TonB family protein